MEKKIKCGVKGCKEDSCMTYLGKRIGKKCWHNHCSNKIDLKKELGIKED